MNGLLDRPAKAVLFNVGAYQRNSQPAQKNQNTPNDQRQKDECLETRNVPAVVERPKVQCNRAFNYKQQAFQSFNLLSAREVVNM